MRIATNAGGLFGFTMTVFDLEVDIGHLEKTVEETISALGSVRNATTQINGGVGVLQPALDALNARISAEEDKLEGIREVKKETIAFLDFMTDTDAEVAKRVRQNKEEFYQAYPHLKPPDPPKEKNIIEKGIDFLGGLYEEGKEFVTEVWNGAKDLVVEGWNNLKDIATEAWNGLVDWYENGGGKEILGIVKDVIFFAVDVTILCVSIVALTPPITALGVAMLCFSIPSTVIGAIDTGISIGNKIVAMDMKADAREAERNGDLAKAEQLRAEANELGEIESLKEIWWNDGEFNGWDILGVGFVAIDIGNIILGGVDSIPKVVKSGWKSLELVDKVDSISTIINFFDDTIGDIQGAGEVIFEGIKSFDFKSLDFSKILLPPIMPSPLINPSILQNLVV